MAVTAVKAKTAGAQAASSPPPVAPRPRTVPDASGRSRTAAPAKAPVAQAAEPAPPAAPSRRRQVPLTPMRRETAKRIRKLAEQVQESHPDMTVHDHLRDAARVLESGNEEGAQRHLRAAMFSLSPQSLMRNGLHTDDHHQAARSVMHGVHRHLLLVKDITDAAAKNQQALRRDSYGDDSTSNPLPKPAVSADPNAGYGPGALAQKPTARQPPGNQAMNAPNRSSSGGSDPNAAAPDGPQPRGSKQFAYGWGDLACVIALTGDGHGHHVAGTPDEWKHGYIPLTEAAARAHGKGKVPKGWHAPSGSGAGKAAQRGAAPDTSGRHAWAMNPEKMDALMAARDSAKADYDRAIAAHNAEHSQQSLRDMLTAKRKYSAADDRYESTGKRELRKTQVANAKRITAADKEGLPGLVRVGGSNPDGSMIAVDHNGTEHTISLKNGQVTVTRDGKSASAPAGDNLTRTARVLAKQLASGDAGKQGGILSGPHPADRLTVAADPKATAKAMSDEDLQRADVELSRRATLLGKAGQKSRAHKAVAAEMQRRGTSLSVTWDDHLRVIEMSAQTAQLERTPAPRGRPGGPGLYDVKGLGHTPYLQQVVKALIEKRGMDPDRAYAVARGAIRKWGRGGGHVHPEVQAAASKAESGELARQARAKAIHGHAVSWDDIGAAVELATVLEFFNPAQPRLPVGPGGGQFAGGGAQPAGAQGQQPAAKQAPAQTPAQKAAAAAAAQAKAAHAAHVAHVAHVNGVSTQKAELLVTAQDDRQKAAGLIKQRDALLKALQSAAGKVSTGQAGAKTATTAKTKSTAPAAKSTSSTAAASTTAKTTTAKTSTSTAKTTTAKAASTTAASSTAGSAAAMKAQIGQLNTQINQLLAQAKQAETQAATMK